MSYTLAEVQAIDLNDFELLELAADDIPAEAEALCCEYVFGYSIAAHDYEVGHLVVITDNEEEGGGDQCRLITAKPAAYCAAFALQMATEAAAESAELFMSNSVVQQLYPELEAQADGATTVIYRDAKTYRNGCLGTYQSRTEAEAEVAKQGVDALSLWYIAERHLQASGTN
jgi:hypothetical protein